MRGPETTTASVTLVSGVMLLLAVTAALFHLWTAGVAPFTALVQRPIHLALFAFLGFLGLGVRRSAVSRARADGVLDAETDPGAVRTTTASATGARIRPILSWVLALLSLVSFLYLAFEHQALVGRSGTPTPLDLILGVVALALVLELARRAAGWGLVVVASLALAYAFVGPWLPGILAHRGYSVARVVEHLYLSTEGIWGIPLGVSADFVYLFILFGAVFDIAGGGALLIALADRVAGRTRGGPAKTAAVASCFMGSLSGSAVANVVTTGAFTIPLMTDRLGCAPSCGERISCRLGPLSGGSGSRLGRRCPVDLSFSGRTGARLAPASRGRSEQEVGGGRGRGFFGYSDQAPG